MHAAGGAVAVIGRVGTMGTTIPIRWEVPTPKACIRYIRKSLATADSALSLYPSVEDSLPKRWDTLLRLHLPWAAHTVLTKLSREKPELTTSALSGCRTHRLLVSLQCLTLWPYPARSYNVIYVCLLPKTAFAAWSKYLHIALQSVTAACPHPRVFL